MRFRVSLCFLFLLCLTFASCYPFKGIFDHLVPNTSPRVAEKAVESLITRLIGSKSSLFAIEVSPSLSVTGKDVFEIKKGDKVYIKGSTGVAAAWGFNFYLKEYCNCHISWDGDQLNLPDILPDVNVKVEANDKFRYYQNVCTTSYSFVWWNWTRWEREIDWMAMNGFNLVLAFNGQEDIWRQVYTELGLNQYEIDEHFSGPAFLAWNRMGNMRGWGGPLTASWHKKNFYLQKKIISRMRQFQITPVLPAFSGIVPKALKRVFPFNKFTEMQNWNNFDPMYCCPYLIEPEDPLFLKIGSLFLKRYINAFGTNHVYNCDTFNEMIPKNGSTNYLKQVGKSIFNSLISQDPDAVWMLQGWLFKNEEKFWNYKRSKAFLTSVIIGRLIVLDLQAELNPQYKRLDNFFGQAYIWCMLHNFGGTLGLHGTMKRINEEVFKARQNKNSSLIGTGITPEGINQNYIIYDLMMDMSWMKKPTNLEYWINKYATRRYGVENKIITNALILLKNSVYNYDGILSHHGRYIFVKSPRLHLKPEIWYDPNNVMKAWKSFNSYSYLFNNSALFKNDLVDLTRQVIQLLLDDAYMEIIDVFENGNSTKLEASKSKFLSYLYDMDTVLSSDSHFLLGKWIEDARACGTNDEEKKLYEWNARNQITLWGPTGQILDYAAKQWAGLVKDYYMKRWETFFECLEANIENPKEFDEKYCSLAIYYTVELPFTYEDKKYPIKPIGNSFDIAANLNQKFGNYMERKK